MDGFGREILLIGVIFANTNSNNAESRMAKETTNFVLGVVAVLIAIVRAPIGRQSQDVLYIRNLAIWDSGRTWEVKGRFGLR